MLSNPIMLAISSVLSPLPVRRGEKGSCASPCWLSLYEMGTALFLKYCEKCRSIKRSNNCRLRCTLMVPTALSWPELLGSVTLWQKALKWLAHCLKVAFVGEHVNKIATSEFSGSRSMRRGRITAKESLASYLMTTISFIPKLPTSMGLPSSFVFPRALSSKSTSPRALPAVGFTASKSRSLMLTLISLYTNVGCLSLVKNFWRRETSEVLPVLFLPITTVTSLSTAKVQSLSAL